MCSTLIFGPLVCKYAPINSSFIPKLNVDIVSYDILDEK